MKDKSLFTALFFILLFSNCEKNNNFENPLAGKWYVHQVIGGFSEPKNYEKKNFTWEFNFNTMKVTIINRADIFDALHTASFTNNRGGAYSFKIETENNIDFLVVANRKGEIKFTKEGLTIDYGIAVDDIAYVFKR